MTKNGNDPLFHVVECFFDDGQNAANFLACHTSKLGIGTVLVLLASFFACDVEPRLTALKGGDTDKQYPGLPFPG